MPDVTVVFVVVFVVSKVTVVVLLLKVVLPWPVSLGLCRPKESLERGPWDLLSGRLGFGLLRHNESEHE